MKRRRLSYKRSGYKTIRTKYKLELADAAIEKARAIIADLVLEKFIISEGVRDIVSSYVYTGPSYG